MNALKTGIYSRHTVLPDEDKAEFNRLRLQLHEEWQPLGRTEIELVEKLAVLFWRQRRLTRGESGLFAMYRECPGGVGGVATALAREGQDTQSFTRLLHMDSAVERSIASTIKLLQELRSKREERSGLTGADR